MTKQITKEALIAKAVESKQGYHGIQLPVINMHYVHFTQDFGIDPEQHYTLEAFIRNVSYADKRSLFEELGFNVHYMALDFTKVTHFIRDEKKGASLQQQFLDQKRNFFIVDVNNGMHKSIMFVIEYQMDAEPLAALTVDYEQLEKDRKQGERLRAIFSKNKNKTTTVSDDDGFWG